MIERLYLQVFKTVLLENEEFEGTVAQQAIPWWKINNSDCVEDLFDDFSIIGEYRQLP